MSEPESGKTPDGAGPGARTSFFAELKKRRVYRAAAAYAVIAWGVTEILEGVIGGLGWPDWLATLAVIIFVTGFPVAMFLAWVFDWTPDGIQRTAPSGTKGWMPIVAASVFLIAGTAGLFWLINPSGIARLEQVGIAVLACRYRGDPEFEFRGEGIAEVINDRLAHSAQLFVPDFASVLNISASGLDTARLAERLSVSWLVECRLAEDNDQLKIDANLVDVSGDESSALISMDIRPLEIINALDAIEEAVLDRLDIPAAHQSAGEITETYSLSLRAIDAYWQGQQAMRTGTADALRQAREHFGNAQIAGDFYLANIREADAMLELVEADPPATATAKATALKAIGLMLDEAEGRDSVPADLYASRLRHANVVDRVAPDTTASEEQRTEWFEHATTVKPNFVEPYRLYAEYLVARGRDDEAAAFTAEVKRLAPEL